MLIHASQLKKYPVLSLHTAAPIGETIDELVDPNSLKIVAWTLKGPQVGTEDYGDILIADSVREFSEIGMIIDSIDELVSAGDVVKIDKVRSLHFKLIGMKVVSKRGKNMGKVSDYTVDPVSLKVMQLIVKRPALKSFMDAELTINRGQIAEVDDYKITIKSEESDILRGTTSADDFVPNFVNPFHGGKFAPNHMKNPASKDTE